MHYIVRLLLENPDGLTGTQLSKYCRVSTRTIRSDIQRINEETSHQIISSKQTGYQLIHHGSDRPPKEEVPVSRVIYIMQQLFLGPVSLLTLMDKLYISESTLNTDLVKIKQMISAYPKLKLVRKKGVLTLEGSEITKRKLYKNLLSTEISQQFEISAIAQWYPTIPFNQCMTIFDDVLEKHHVSIRHEGKTMLLIHLGILLERISQNRYLSEKITTQIGELEWDVANEFFQCIQPYITVDVPKSEVLALAHLLQGYQTQFDVEERVYIGGQYINISDLVDKVVHEAFVYSGIDFKKDSEFLKGVHLHLQGLLKRLENRVMLSNPLVDNMKHHHPLMFDMAVYVSQSIEQLVGMSISESEIAFIALHLGVSYVRLTEKRKIQVVLVANENTQFTSLIAHKLNSTFSSKLEIVKIVSYWDMTNLDAMDIDLIISIGRLQTTTPVPTVVISGFMTEQEERYIFDKIQQIEKQQLLTNFSVQIEKMLDDSFYYYQLDKDNPEDVICFMTQELIKKGVVSSDYTDEVLKRESISSTSFAQGLAVPHALSKCIKRSGISVAVLNKPICWGRYDVQLVVMLTLSDSQRSFIPLFFDGLLGVIEDKHSLERLLSASDAATFLQHIIVGS